MSFRRAALRVGICLVTGGLFANAWLGQVQATAPALSGLSFREVDITGDEFVVLVNNDPAAVQLNTIWLGYTSGDASSTPVPVQQLPDLSLKPGQVLLLSSGGTLATCDASVITKLDFSLSNTAGQLALWQQNGGSFNELTHPGAMVRWGKSTSKTTLPPGEIDLTEETGQYTVPVWYFTAAGGWELTNLSGCDLTTYTSSSDTTGTQIASWPLNTSEPPAVIVSLASADDSTMPHIPAADIGLKPPQLTELLPNPSGQGTDNTDEFIELYNANLQPFDLSGFTLQTGSTTRHSYVFPTGTQLPARGFKAFYSAETGLSLSNAGGQADLLDPFGTPLTQTDAYGNAKDGLAWSLANGTWYWTNQSTPNAPNVINQTTGGSKVAKNKVATTLKTGAVKGAKATGSSAAASPADSLTADTTPAPIHTGVLAAVAAAAVAYGLYEYRHDVANKFHRFREHRAARRKTRH